MFTSLNRVDWNLLHEQKLVLLAMRKQHHKGSAEADALSGIVHLLDALQDDAAADGPCDSQPDKRDVTLRFTLDNDWIELSLTYADAKGRRTGSVTSSLHSSEEGDKRFNAAIDAVESMVLAHACAGMDVTDPRYVDGIRTCVEACANNLEGGDA